MKTEFRGQLLFTLLWTDGTEWMSDKWISFSGWSHGFFSVMSSFEKDKLFMYPKCYWKIEVPKDCIAEHVKNKES